LIGRNAGRQPRDELKVSPLLSVQLAKSDAVQMSLSRICGNLKPGGMTPMIEYGFSESSNVRESTLGSLPKRETHVAWLSTTTGCPASDAENVRPSAGRAPSTSNRFGVAWSASMRTRSSPMRAISAA